ncbi:GAF domain-containing protein [Effusibacillus dendaii]|uniref:GAF domain-containing protein n=1 Tax=Effusibacillus dendaii TaxID=2743772 RepID=A0A7I8D816_9BACL|nr:hypothetical protein [Effusibacillus dendaii]BCJ86288.1 hypothetical protein skT53_12730 [Effusibacillus dendaii]
MSNIASKLFRYEALLNAIEVFTQKFSLDQICNFAFEFTNEVLTLHASMLFVKQGDDFVSVRQKLYPFENYRIENSERLERIATFHGKSIRNRFELFFAPKDIDYLTIRFVIPLIIHDTLYGFIISDGKILGELDDDDYDVANKLMSLVNHSLENSKQFADLQAKNQLLDQTNFNLFMINQSTKALLSEVTLDKLYANAIDVFSEVSRSAVTSLGIYDEWSDTIKIRGYRDVFSHSKQYAELQLHKQIDSGHKIVLSMEHDQDIIQSIFVNWQQFAVLRAKYIVLIVKDRVIGFVTLSESVDHHDYDESYFQLIESLASATYIAVNNALLFDEISAQKKTLEQKYNTLNNLNKLVNTINHCDNQEEICYLTLRTLHLSFGIKKAFICFKKNGFYLIEHAIGAELHQERFVLSDPWQKTFDGDTVFEYTTASAHDFFNDAELVESFGNTNCIVISPLLFHNPSAYPGQEPEGFLVILETKDILKEEEVLLIDTIAKNISPILRQIKLTDAVKERYVEDVSKKFLAILAEKIRNREQYQIEFYLYYRKIERNPFQAIDPNTYPGLETYFINPYLFVLTYEPLADPQFKEIPRIQTALDLLQYPFI